MSEVRLAIITQPSVEEMAQENVSELEGFSLKDGVLQVPDDHPLVTTVSTLRKEKKELEASHTATLLALEDSGTLAIKEATDAAQTTFDELLESTKTDLESAHNVTVTELRSGAVRDKIALAARSFIDPNDAVALVLAGKPVSAFIESDALDDMISAEVKALSETKPHLLAGKTPQTQLDPGARGSENEEKSGTMQMSDMVRESVGY